MPVPSENFFSKDLLFMLDEEQRKKARNSAILLLVFGFLSGMPAVFLCIGFAAEQRLLMYIGGLAVLFFPLVCIGTGAEILQNLSKISFSELRADFWVPFIYVFFILILVLLDRLLSHIW